MTDTRPDVQDGAPAPQRDTERKPLIKITRLPYLSVVAIALVVVAIVGALTLSTRLAPRPNVTGLDVSTGQTVNPNNDLTPR